MKVDENGTTVRAYDHFAGKFDVLQCAMYCGCNGFTYGAHDGSYCWCGDDTGVTCDSSDCFDVSPTNYIHRIAILFFIIRSLLLVYIYTM